ncbi:hypothetical protein C7999DRAFT_14155 [Corynascus novoguineensis]|uniref:Enoyl reductase (ER) domain-containing protein n=1 Tax=Corynascus novoguineensis TaxID=1126955 RepID=A0AAN7CT83_9PEZI|nr:hypothetical protein C7999DRAFT_14155 [Corynascus novoguineensis]
MKAIQIIGPKSKPTVSLNGSHPLPTPDSSGPEILIRVHSAGLTADELTWPELWSPLHNPTHVPGFEVSGAIAELPPSYIGPLAVGDEVYAMLHTDRGKGQAEYVYARPGGVARKPRSLSFAQAAALPIPALTAWEALLKRAWPSGPPSPPSSSLRVLVTGASGAVGSMVVQLAKNSKVIGKEVQVVALASAAKHDYLRELGADETVDYHDDNKTGGWERKVGIKSVDAVFDAAGGDVLAKAWATVKDDGVVVTVADPPPAWATDKGPGAVPKELEGRPGVRYIYFIVSPDSEALGKIAGLIDEGTVKPLSVVEYPVDKAVEAWDFARQRGRQGKVVVNFVPAA